MKRIAVITLRIAMATAILIGVTDTPKQMAWSAPKTRMVDPAPLNPGEVRKLKFPATHVVVQWTGRATDTVAVRGKGLDGNWDDWIAIDSTPSDGGPEGAEAQRVDHPDQDPALDPNAFTERESDVLVVDNVVELETKVHTGKPSDIKVAAIDTRNGPRKLEVVETGGNRAEAINGLSPQPQVIRRSQWGANESLRRGSPEFAKVDRIVVHHTATANADPDPAATVRAIYQWHTQGNGWNDIGYNFLIDQNGRIYEGRKARDYAPGEIPTGESTWGAGVIGAHAAGSNTGSVGIAMLGNFESQAPRAATQDALVRLMAWSADRNGIDPQAPGRIVGHRDVYQTACPGRVAHAHLGLWRNWTAGHIAVARPIGNTPGYTIAQENGAVKAFGSAKHFGSMEGKALNAPIQSMVSTPDQNGYWLLGRDGGIFTFGNAGFYGSTGAMRLNAPIVGMAATPSGKGYWLVASDGGIFTFGDAQFKGSTGAMRLNAPVVGMSASASGNGYMLVASDGGIFTFGDAQFKGSTGAMKLNSPIVSIASTSDGSGYWLFGDDGGIFSFGTQFFGSVPMLGVGSFSGVAQAEATSTNQGYYVLSRSGGVYTFGDARFWGATSGVAAAGISVLPE